MQKGHPLHPTDGLSVIFFSFFSSHSAPVDEPFPSYYWDFFQQFGQAQYSHKRREIFGRNLVKGNLHLVTKLVDYPFLVTAQLHGTVKFFLDLCEGRLWIGGGAVGDMGLTNILNDTVQIIMDRVAKKVTFLYLSQLQRANIMYISPL